MATDWAKHVRKYAPQADDAVIAGLVRYCGIALRNRDSALVSFSDAKELARVRGNFLKKKLGLTAPDEVLDAEIAKVGLRLKGDRSKHRVTVYYLLAEAQGKLDLFVKAPAAKAPAAKPAVKQPAAAKPVAAAKPPKAPATRKPTKPAGSAAGGVALLAANLGDKAGSAIASAADTASEAASAAAHGAADLAGKAADVVGEAVDNAVEAVGTGTAAAMTAAAGLASGAADRLDAAAQHLRAAAEEEPSGLGWLWLLLLAVLATFALWWLFLRG